ncbi:hypothetical protein GJ496_004209 [Pomphorhynchus laevis]|nr:hypothetical protein GJ496_004209 [Pomphorhynchus laevis]
MRNISVIPKRIVSVNIRRPEQDCNAIPFTYSDVMKFKAGQKFNLLNSEFALVNNSNDWYLCQLHEGKLPQATQHVNNENLVIQQLFDKLLSPAELFTFTYKCSSCEYTDQHRDVVLNHAHENNHYLSPEQIFCLQVYSCSMPCCTAKISFPHTKRKQSVKVQTLLEHHLLSSHVKYKINCTIPDCSSAFLLFNDLQSHMYKVHSKKRTGKQNDVSLLASNIQNNVCEQCDREFTSLFNLRVHMRFHEKDRPYQCELCGKSFHTSSNYNRHRLKYCGKIRKPVKRNRSIKHNKLRCNTSGNSNSANNIVPAITNDDQQLFTNTQQFNAGAFELFDLDWLNIESNDLCKRRPPNVITISRDMESMMSLNLNYLNGSARTDYVCNYMAKHRASLRRNAIRRNRAIRETSKDDEEFEEDSDEFQMNDWLIELEAED